MECEAELFALFEDMADGAVWVRHGTGRGGSTVWQQKPEPGTPTGLIRFRTEIIMEADVFEAVCAINEVRGRPTRTLYKRSRLSEFCRLCATLSSRDLQCVWGGA